MKESNELEVRFIAAVQAFTASDDSTRDELQFNFFRAYSQLLSSVNDEPEKRDQKLAFIFSVLIEALDKTEGQIATVLYQYTFGDFLESYCEETVIQSTARDYIMHNRLSKVPLYIALGSRINAD